MNILLIDGPFEVSRLYHATQDIKSVASLFVRDIVVLLQRYEFNLCVTAWDDVKMFQTSGAYYERTLIDNNYKSSRVRPDDGIWSEIQNKILPNVGVEQVFFPGAEADDIIANLTKLWQKDNYINILANDHDYLCLLNNKVSILRSVSEKVTNKDFLIQNGYEAKRHRDILVLTGDKSDNISGVGIGIETAKRVIKGFDSIEELLELEDIELDGKIISKQKLSNNLNIMKFSKIKEKDLIVKKACVNLDNIEVPFKKKISYNKVLSYYLGGNNNE